MTTSRTALVRRTAPFAAVVVAALLAGCSSTNDAAESASGDAETTEELVPLSYQTSWIPLVQFGGTYVAEEAGYFEAEGIDLDLLPGGPEVDGMALLESGTVDIAVSNADVVAQANANGADLVIVAAGFQKSPLAIVSLADDPIESPEDMEGKTIGVPSGDTATHDAFVDVNGLDADEITVVPVSFDVAPLLSGEVDGQYVFYTEQPIAVEEAGEEPATMLLADYNLNVYAQVYVVTRETLETRADEVESFLRAEIMGWQDYVADPTEAVDLTVNEYGADSGLTVENQTRQAELQMDVLVTPTTEEHGLLWMSDEDIQTNLDTISALGIDVDSSLFDTSLLEDIYQGGSTVS